VPAAASVPLQPPDAVHDVALVELHVSVEVPPAGTLVGFAFKVAVGAEVTVTVTVATGLTPPVPLHASEKEVSAVRTPVL
jgi:hypothetical protein